jgi:enoyl-CoA hydratase/carnithine racemase
MEFETILFETILFVTVGATAVVTLNLPERRNALSLQRGPAAALTEADDRTAIHCAERRERPVLNNPP